MGLVAILGGVVVVSVVAWWTSATPGPAIPWGKVGTEDVHSIAFGSSPDTMFIGHHGGVLTSADAGLTWKPLPVRQDAMALGVGAAGRLYIAGHGVLLSSADAGQTWTPVAAPSLPTLDIHALAVDAAEPARLWTFVAGAGLYVSNDGGSSWAVLSQAVMPFLAAYRGESRTELIGVDAARGLVRSVDLGLTWHVAGDPGAYPVTALAASPGGRRLFVGTPNAVLYSADRGDTWIRVAMPGTPVAIATATDGDIVAVVLSDGQIFRSSDGGATWRGRDVH